MSKAVLISIRPKWCEKIANGEKTVEVRKTQPKLKTPFKCYIYRTKGTVKHLINDKWVNMPVGGTVIGEFVCDRVFRGSQGYTTFFWDICIPSRLTEEEIIEYQGDASDIYGWHISDLQIYDTLKELSEFTPSCRYGEDGECLKSKEVLCLYQKHDFNPDGSVNLVSCSRRAKRPPQSWCYVEELPGGDG